jgi:hypothetical protein
LPGFCTKAEVVARLQLGSDTSFDTIIDQLVLGVATMMEGIAGRQLHQEAVTEYHSGGTELIRVAVSPIKTTGTVTIRESESYDWTTSGEYTELAVNEDYIFRPGERPGSSGIIRRLNQFWSGNHETLPGTIKVVYTGGYIEADAEWDMPEDLKTAAIAQICYEIERRKNPGRISHSQRGVGIASGFGSTYDGQLDILPETKNVAMAYRRVAAY